MHAVSMLSQFNTCYGESDWNAAKRVLQYLIGTKSHGMGSYSKRPALNFWFFQMQTGVRLLTASPSPIWWSCLVGLEEATVHFPELIALSEACKEAVYARPRVQLPSSVTTRALSALLIKMATILAGCAPVTVTIL
jgi:hypothetical protein